MNLRMIHVSTELFENPRRHSGLDDASLNELALSIVATGLLNPLIVRSDGLLLAGQRRLFAINRIINWESFFVDAGLSEEMRQEMRQRFEERAKEFLEDVPVKIVDDGDAEEIALVDNLHREDISSYETAAYVARMATTRTQARIARALGKSPTWVSRQVASWNGSDEETKRRWKLGHLSFEQVLRIVSDDPATGRGPANRPGIDAVKDERRRLLLLIEEETSPDRKERLSAAAQAIEWVTGGQKLPPSEAV